MAEDYGLLGPNVERDIDNSSYTGYGYTDGSGYEATRRDSSHIGVELIRAGINRSTINDRYVDSLYERTPGVNLTEGLDDYVQDNLYRLMVEGDNNTSTNEQVYGQWTRGPDGVLRRSEGGRTFDNVYQRMNGDRNEVYNNSGYDHNGEVTYMLTDPWVTGRPVDPEDEDPFTRDAIFRQESQKRLKYQTARLIPDKGVRDVMAPGMNFRLANQKEWRELTADTMRRQYYNTTRPDGTLMDVYQTQKRPANIPFKPQSNISRVEDSYYASDAVKAINATRVIRPSEFQAAMSLPTIEAGEQVLIDGKESRATNGIKQAAKEDFVPNLSRDPVVRRAQAMNILKKKMEDAIIDLSDAPDQRKTRARRNLRVPSVRDKNRVSDMALVEQVRVDMIRQITMQPAQKLEQVDTIDRRDVAQNQRNLMRQVAQGKVLDVLSTIRASDSARVNARRAVNTEGKNQKIVYRSEISSGDAARTYLKAKLFTESHARLPVENTINMTDQMRTSINGLNKVVMLAPETTHETCTGAIIESTNNPVLSRKLGYDRYRAQRERADGGDEDDVDPLSF